MSSGWRWTAGLLLALVGSGVVAGSAGDGSPAGLGVPALLFPAGGAADDAGADVAARAERRLRSFLSGAGPADSLVLDEAAVEAVLRNRLEGRLPRGVDDLRVELRGPTAAVSATVLFGRLEVGGQAPERLSRFLGDSARVEVEVEPSVAGPGSGRVALRGLKAGGLTLPSGLLPFVLSQLGVETEGGDEPRVSVPVPRAVTSIEVGDARLVVGRAGSD